MRVAILLASLLVAATAPAAAEEVAIIVNKANNQSIDKDWVAKVYRGEIKTWAGGTPITAYDLPEDNAVRASFSKDFLRRSVANMKALWAQFTFSGKAVPPKQVASDDDVKKAVAGNKNAIGYINAASADDSIRVVAQ
jgi:ABC-type phosphate transport system substrate-binding protein